MKILTFVIFLFHSGQLFAEAFCALRDPISQIRALYPEATHHKSIVKDIDASIAQSVKEQLPNNELHYGELGRHTLYVTYKGSEILGYVHVRSERSSWGLIETVWAISPNLTVDNFMFQRCRTPKKKLIDDTSFKSLFLGNNYQALKKYMSEDGKTGNNDYLKYALDAPELANVVLRCALKTLLITQIVWEKDLNKG